MYLSRSNKIYLRSLYFALPSKEKKRTFSSASIFLENMIHTLNGIVSLTFAVFFGWTAWHGLRMRLKTSKWDETRSYVVSQSDYQLFGYTFNCNIKYEYRVKGKVFYGTRTNNWDSGTNPMLCEKLRPYTEEDPFRIYVDPNDPKESVVDNTLDPFYYSVLVGLSLYDASEAFLSFRQAGIMPYSLLVFSTVSYLIMGLVSLFYVGVTNFQYSFASAFMALAMSLYISAVIVQGFLNGYNGTREIYSSPLPF